MIPIETVASVCFQERYQHKERNYNVARRRRRADIVAFFDRVVAGAADFTSTGRHFVHWDQVNETQLRFLTMLKTGEVRGRQTERLLALALNTHFRAPRAERSLDPWHRLHPHAEAGQKGARRLTGSLLAAHRRGLAYRPGVQGRADPGVSIGISRRLGGGF